MPNERTFQWDLSAEIDRYFDASSVPHDEPPRIVIFMGGPAAGKTTLRRQHCATGYVLVDAAEIFLSLSRGEFFPFPEAFEEPLELVGQMVARRAVAERRHIVTELIGADLDATNALLEAMNAIGYEISAEFINCDVEEAMRRNLARGDDNISCYYAEPFQRRWLLEAANRVSTATSVANSISVAGEPIQ
jgi:hypothetical protein